MKKNLFLILTLLIAITTNAQITITDADFGNTFFRAIQANDNTMDTAYIHVGNPGANQTWSFDSLHNDYIDTLQFMTVASTPFASSFASIANIAYTKTNSPGTYNFGNASSSGVNAIGLGLEPGTFPISLTTPAEAVILSTPETYMNFPSTYNSHFSVSTHGVVNDDTTFTYSIFHIDTVQIRTYITDSSLIDAWGTLTTPFGSAQALRQKFMEYTVDSIYVHDTTLGWQYSMQNIIDSTLTYRWFANGQGYPVVEILMNSTWLGDSTADWITSSNTGVPQLSNNISRIVLYPNPASTEVNILNSFNEVSYLYIYDMMGRLINEMPLRDKITTISTSEYSNGLYSYRVLDANNVPLSSGKFNIIK